MKIAFIFGKGIDGCGVTRGALIFENYLRQAGHDTFIVDFDNGQTFGRAQDADWHGEVLKVNKKVNDVDTSVVDKINSCNIAIFHSHPTRKQAQYSDRYRRFLEKIDQPIIVMHDHAIAKTNVNAVPQACEIFSKADVCVIQSLVGYSNEAYTNFDPGLSSVIMENPIWLDPKEYDIFNKKAEDRQKHLLYLGRMSPLKDPAMICRMDRDDMKDWDLSIIGCENSISSVSMYSDDLTINPSPYVPAFRQKIYQHSLNKQGVYTLNDKEKAKDGRINSYDRYKYDFGMNSLGTSFASWCGYKLSNTAEYGNRMEYTMIESFLLTLPIINTHFAENGYSPEGKLWGEYDGPLICQAREEDYLADKLNYLWDNKSEWSERTQACRDLIFKFNSIENLGAKFLTDVMAIGKRANKINAIDTITNYFPEAKELREQGKIIMSSANGTLKRTPLIVGDDGKQEIYKAPVNTLESFFA
jgi:hypothetical protein